MGFTSQYLDATLNFGTDVDTKMRRQRETGFILGLRLAIDEARKRGYYDFARDLAEVALSDLAGEFASMTITELRAIFAAGTARAELDSNGKPILVIVEGGKR